MRIEVPTHDGMLGFRLFGRDTSLSVGDSVDIAPDMVARYDGTMAFRSVGIPEVVMFVLSVPANVVATLAANQIWTWLQSRAGEAPLKVVIEGREVPYEVRTVKAALIACIEASNDNESR